MKRTDHIENIVSHLDQKANTLLENGFGSEDLLLSLDEEDMYNIETVMSASSNRELNKYLLKYSGFGQYLSLLEIMATGLENGMFPQSSIPLGSPSPLANLTLNTSFVRELISEEGPCFALGHVEEEGEVKGCFALKPEKVLPQASTQQGFCFGQSVLAFKDIPVFHFAFEFYDDETFNGLVTTDNPVVQSVLETIIKTQDHFFLVFNSDSSLIAFKHGSTSRTLIDIESNYEKFKDTECSTDDYEEAVQWFAKNPHPEGQIMKWVCRDNIDYLDLSTDRFDLNPKS